MRRFLTIAIAVLGVPVAASAQMGPLSTPTSLISPYGMDQMSPSSGQSMTPHVGTRASTGPLPDSQFSTTGTNQLYGNYGNTYNPAVPNDVYIQQDLTQKPAPQAPNDQQPRNTNN